MKFNRRVKSEALEDRRSEPEATEWNLQVSSEELGSN